MTVDTKAIRESAVDRNQFLDAYATLVVTCDEIDRLRCEVERIANSFMNGEHDCNVCGRVTANGTCTDCRHGTSPLLKARAEVDRLRAAITQALVQFETGDPLAAEETLRAAIGIEEGP